MSGIVSAALQAAAQIGNTIATNVANKRNMERANQFNRNMAMSQMMFQQNQFDQANAYNDPRSQMQRFIDAGLNPYSAIENSQPSATPQTGASANSVTPQGFQSFIDPSVIDQMIMQHDAQRFNQMMALKDMDFKNDQLNAQKDQFLADYLRQLNNDKFDNLLKWRQAIGIKEGIRQKQEELSETNRHNMATESLGSDQLQETIRHNKSTEDLGDRTLQYNIDKDQKTDYIRLFEYAQKQLDESVFGRLKRFNHKLNYKIGYHVGSTAGHIYNWFHGK